MAIEPKEKVIEIIWLENPFSYDYVREISILTTRRYGKPNLSNLESYYKLVGYENVAKRKRDRWQLYFRRVWWLKEYDRGCPKECGAYSEGGLRPAEAVSPDEIIIPEGTRVIKAYEIEKVIPEIRRNNTWQINKLWEESKIKKIPYFALEISRDYAVVKYDFFPIDYNLKEDAAYRLYQLFEEFLENMDVEHRKLAFKGRSITYSFGETMGFIHSLRIYEARLFAKIMKRIIMDKNNWVDLYSKHR